MINFQLRNRAALTLSKPKMPVSLLLSPLPHYMWFGEKASHSWFQFSCLLKEAEYPCMFIDALDSQLVRLTPNLKSPAGLQWIITHYQGMSYGRVFTAFFSSNYMSKLVLFNAENLWSTLMKRSTLQQLLCFLFTNFVVWASRLCRESCVGGQRTFHIFITFNKRGKNHKRVCHFQPTQLLSQIFGGTAWFKSYDTHEVLLQPWTTLIELTGHGDASSLYSSLVRPEMEKHVWFWAPLQERCVLAGESPEKNNNWKTASRKKNEDYWCCVTWREKSKWSFRYMPALTM